MIQNMIRFDHFIKEEIKEHIPNWPQILDHPYRMLIIGGFGSGNSLLNVISQQPYIDKIYSYPYETKYQFLSNKRESTAFTEYSNDMDDIKTLKNITQINISIAFITQFHFVVPKNIRLNSTHYFFMKISNKRELQQIAFTYSSDTDFKDFMNLYKNVLQNHILF